MTRVRAVTPKAIHDVPDAEPAVTGELLTLCRWIAEYYVVPLGVALRCALPALLTGAGAPEPSQRTHRVVTLARHVESLNQAVATRQLIGQAIGILMERYVLSEQAAQAFLWRTSSHGNTKVRAVAADLVDDADRRARSA